MISVASSDVTDYTMSDMGSVIDPLPKAIKMIPSGFRFGAEPGGIFHLEGTFASGPLLLLKYRPQFFDGSFFNAGNVAA